MTVTLQPARKNLDQERSGKLRNLNTIYLPKYSMANEDNGSETLDQKHRREKKELQAEIMLIKRQIKGDKNRKKELTAEIVRLEHELEEKQKKETEEVEFKVNGTNKNLQVSDEESIPEASAYTKVSKAQKRRDKKAQEERERNERIKQQEKENLQGPRTLEALEITSKLKDAKLKLHLIPSDGDCLYSAISHQLSETSRKVLEVKELREATSTYIRENKDDFLPFMSHPETFVMLTDGEFEEYCHSIINTKTWGGQLEIRAMSNVLKCPIHVVQSGQETVKQGDEMEDPPLIITYHKHMYGLGEHYNSSMRILTEY